MKVVLIVPPFDLSAAWGSAKRMKEGVLPPLGVGYLAAALEDRGHTVELLDAPSQGWGLDQTADYVAASGSVLAGISCLTVRSGAAYELSRAIKARCPGMIVAMGGPHVTAFHEHILDECPEIDVLFPGEAEISFSEFVDAVAAGHPWNTLLGVVYRDADGTVCCAPSQPLVRDLDTLTPPARHLYPKDLYRPLPSQGRRFPSTIMLTSRGCPWSKCRFCYQGARYGHPYRRRSPENCIEELCHLVRDLGYREIMFWDDNFCVNEQWVSTFCGLLDKERLNITWTVEGHVRTVTLSMLKRMAASGCYNIFLGLETGTQEMLDLVEKGFTIEQSRTAVALAKEANMEVRASFILGFPTETPEMADQTIRFACEVNPDFANFVPYHVWPGTPLEEFSLLHGRRIAWNDDLLRPSYFPDSFGSSEGLDKKLKEAYRRFYLRPRYIASTLWRLRRPHFTRRVLIGSRYWFTLMRRGTIKDRRDSV